MLNDSIVNIGRGPMRYAILYSLTANIVGAKPIARVLGSAVALDILSALLVAMVPAMSAAALEHVIADKLGDSVSATASSSLAESLRAFSMTQLCAGALLFSALAAGLRMQAVKLVSEFTIRARMGLRDALFSRAVAASFGKADLLTPGEGVSLIRQDASLVGEFLQSTLHPLLSALIRTIAVTVVVALYDIRILPFAMAFLPLVLISQHVWETRVQPLFSIMQSERVQSDRVTAAVLRGLRVVRALGRTRHEHLAWRGHEERIAGAERQVMILNRWILASWDVAIPAASIALLWWSASVKDLGASDVLLMSMCLGMLISPMQQFFQVLRTGSVALASAIRVERLLVSGIDDLDRTIAIRQEGTKPTTLRIDRVSFQYLNRTEMAVSDVSFEMELGTMLSIVGPSGSGKSTLASLIAGVLSPMSGSVFILQSAGASLVGRVRVALVEQDNHLFEGTIASNIRFGAPLATDTQVTQAAEIACLDEFLTAGSGLETLVGEGGSGLSGGQRCRVSLARALVMDPLVLVIDEFSGQLDAGLELRILQHLQTSRSNRFTILVTHSAEVARATEKVVTITQGRQSG